MSIRGKIKWSNTFLAVLFAVAGAVLLRTAQVVENSWATKQDIQLQAGDLVQHKLYSDWEGIVLWNQDGPKIAIRFTTDGDDSIVWNDTLDVEWKKE